MLVEFWKALGQVEVFGGQQLPDLLAMPMSRFRMNHLAVSYWSRKKSERASQDFSGLAEEL